jgi:hypothetical protein
MRYCRAYERTALLRSPAFAGADSRAAVVYLWDDYSVTADPAPGSESLIDVDAGWRRFCDQELGFTVPVEELRQPTTS